MSVDRQQMLETAERLKQQMAEGDPLYLGDTGTGIVLCDGEEG